MKMGVGPLNITPGDLLAKFLFHVSMTLCSAALEVLVPKRGMLPPEDTTMIPLDWELRLITGHFELLVSLSQQAKKGVTVLVRVIDPDDQGDVKLPLHNGGKEEYVWNTGDPLKHYNLI